jgi:hypothetical protein
VCACWHNGYPSKAMSQLPTKTEAAALTECEKVIERGLSNFIEVGNALMKIRDGKLYRAEFKTFEEYCRKRWSMSRQNAHELIGAAEVSQNLSGTPDKPTSVSQTRHLVSLPPEKQKEVWKEAVETAPEGRVTAAHVEKVKEKFTPLAEEARSKAEEDSEKLWALKSAWRKATNKDRTEFLKWIEQ